MPRCFVRRQKENQSATSFGIPRRLIDINVKWCHFASSMPGQPQDRGFRCRIMCSTESAGAPTGRGSHIHTLFLRKNLGVLFRTCKDQGFLSPLQYFSKHWSIFRAY